MCATNWNENKVVQLSTQWSIKCQGDSQKEKMSVQEEQDCFPNQGNSKAHKVREIECKQENKRAEKITWETPHKRCSSQE